MDKHTPGPWSVPHFAQPEAGCECGYVLTDGYHGAVCTVHCSGHGSAIDTGDNPKFEEACANARLIAAAPDLLRLCKIFLGHDDRFQVAVGGNPIAVDAMLDEARAIISKATGEHSISTPGALK